MKKLLLLGAILGGLSAQAGVLRVTTYPVRHSPRNTAHKVGRGIAHTSHVIWRVVW
jgi:hypothetical protein